MYQKFDKWIDYQTYEHQGYHLRGPAPNLKLPYASFIGAAQCWGRYVKDPYPKLVCNAMGLQCLNLSKAGAGPEEPLFHSQETLDLINGSMFCVIQIMSLRSASNSMFTIKTGQGGKTDLSEYMESEMFWKHVYSIGNKELIDRLIAESKQSYIKNLMKLIRNIKVPTFLLLFANDLMPQDPKKRKYTSFKEFMGSFPQLFDGEFLNQIISYSSREYIECISSMGLPQLLPEVVNDGYQESLGEQPLGNYNTYYPSPEMHVEACGLILNEICHSRTPQIRDNFSFVCVG